MHATLTTDDVAHLRYLAEEFLVPGTAAAKQTVAIAEKVAALLNNYTVYGCLGVTAEVVAGGNEAVEAALDSLWLDLRAAVLQEAARVRSLGGSPTC